MTSRAIAELNRSFKSDSTALLAPRPRHLRRPHARRRSRFPPPPRVTRRRAVVFTRQRHDFHDDFHAMTMKVIASTSESSPSEEKLLELLELVGFASRAHRNTLQYSSFSMASLKVQVPDACASHEVPTLFRKFEVLYEDTNWGLWY